MRNFLNNKEVASENSRKILGHLQTDGQSYRNEIDFFTFHSNKLLAGRWKGKKFALENLNKNHVFHRSKIIKKN